MQRLNVFLSVGRTYVNFFLRLIEILGINYHFFEKLTFFTIIVKKGKNYFDYCKHIYGLGTILGRKEVLSLLEILSLQLKPLIISLVPVSRKPRKPFGPLKPFLIYLYPKIEKPLCMKGTPVHFKNM